MPPPITTATPVYNFHWQNANYTPSKFTYSSPVYKLPKVDFPKFDGKDPRSWIRKCEKYFQLNPSLDARTRVICATLYLEGDVDVWFRSLEEEKPNFLWHEFTEMICNRFSKVGYENLVGQFNKLTQKGRVEEYITQFDELRSHVMSREGHHRILLC